MARLNEASAPPTENLEAVKRRFLRQNRELAKTNSTQSIRIRNLEAEGSRLLAENLSLREQVIQLRHVLETQSNRPSFENIELVKDRLEAKIQELGSLVAELGQIPQSNSEPRCKSQTAATKRSPDERKWRNGGMVCDGEDGKLPTITEDKFYPRKTMNADELQEIIQDPDSQSPDLGPPPVARFENEDPIKFDARQCPIDEVEDEAQDDGPTLSINLETRKKRRDSHAKINIRRSAAFESPPESTPDEAAPRTRVVKVGAKRKMSVLEDDEKPETRNEPRPDGFRFSRRGALNVSDDPVSQDHKDQHDMVSDRPALSNKPVNTDPILSPKKQKASIVEKSDAKKPLMCKAPRGRFTNLQKTIESVEVPPLPVEIAEIPLDSLPPKTPAVDEIFSPPSTEPSTQRPESKDTPPPTDLNPANSSFGQVGPGGRAARRARAPVNYAEPNLVSKMRRPTKELIDAVQSSNDPQRSMSAKAEDGSAPATMEKSKLHSSVIKREREEGSDSAWKSLPSAPGAGAQDEVGERDSPLSKKAGRQSQTESASAPGPDQAPMTLNSSAASNAISALISGSTNSRRRIIAKETSLATTKEESLPTHTKAEEKDKSNQAKPTQPKAEPRSTLTNTKDLAIFDFTESSSPTDASAPQTTSRARIDLSKHISRTARRHSSMAASSMDPNSTSTTGALPPVSSRSQHSVGAVRSASAGTLSSKPTKTTEPKGSREVKKVGAPTQLGAGSGAEDAGGSQRGERAASRRRSMML